MDAETIDLQIEKEARRLIKRELQRLITTAYTNSNAQKSAYEFEVSYWAHIQLVEIRAVTKEYCANTLWYTAINLQIKWSRAPEKIIKQLQLFIRRIKHTAKLPALDTQD